MSPEAIAPVTQTVAPKAKATVAKKATKAKKSAPKAEHQVQYGVERDHDLPWNEKKVAVFTAMKKLGAVSVTSSQSATTIAERANVTARDVRHYCYHAKAAGLVDVAKVEDIRGYGFYLTAKGAKIDPKAELKSKRAD